MEQTTTSTPVSISIAKKSPCPARNGASTLCMYLEL